MTLKNLERTQTSERKKDHIDLAFRSRIDGNELDTRFYYEPLLSGHPTAHVPEPFDFLGKNIRIPLWVSSMTGGTEKAGKINRNLARACNEFGFGMGLGSCRIILEDDTYIDDFRLRKEIGDELPFYANLGIAQVEHLLEQNKSAQISELCKKLEADGLIVHINPLQEWLQPEGDRIRFAPIDTIQRLMDTFKGKIIVKEVGQGMGPESLKQLLQLPVEAIEFAANGGTNFARLELLRASEEEQEIFRNIPYLGHSAEEMVDFSNAILDNPHNKVSCKQLIISGGIKNYLDGFYLLEKSKFKAVYGQASELLKRAEQNYESLHAYLEQQTKGLALAKAFLRIRE